MEKAARGFGDPAPYPFALLKATPSLGTEHLVAPIGAGAIGVFSLATGAMVADAELPGMPSGEHVAALRVLHDYHHPGAAASEKGEARTWRASGLEVRSTPADAYRDKYRSDDVEALRRDLDASLD